MSPISIDFQDFTDFTDVTDFTVIFLGLSDRVVRSSGRSASGCGSLGSEFFLAFRGLSSLTMAGRLGRGGPRRSAGEDLDYVGVDDHIDEGPWYNGPLIVAWGAEEAYHPSGRAGSIGD